MTQEQQRTLHKYHHLFLALKRDRALPVGSWAALQELASLREELNGKKSNLHYLGLWFTARNLATLCPSRVSCMGLGGNNPCTPNLLVSKATLVKSNAKPLRFDAAQDQYKAEEHMVFVAPMAGIRLKR